MSFMKSKRGTCLLAIVLALSLFTFWLAAQQASCTVTKTIEMSLTVDEKARLAVGINADTDHLNFGKVSPLSDVRRSVLVNETAPSQVKVFLRGEVGSWTTVQNPDFSLLSREPYEVEFIVSVPASAQEGNYSGKAIFCFLEE